MEAAEMRRAYYSQGPRLERLGLNRYSLTLFDGATETAVEHEITRRMARRLVPELLASCDCARRLP